MTSSCSLTAHPAAAATLRTAAPAGTGSGAAMVTAVPAHSGATFMRRPDCRDNSVAASRRGVSVKWNCTGRSAGGTGATNSPIPTASRVSTIGSVLRNSVSVVVFTIAGLTILAELNFDLAPLLASAGIAGLALGFGAQSLVKDLIAGLFMLVEDQYGVGDTVDLGEATGVVEAIGLRITTVRDGQGVVWYIRNGEIIRVGNKSQGWAVLTVDMPIGFTNVEEALAVLRPAAQGLADDEQFAADIMEPPEVLGVEQMTVDGAVVRTVTKSTADGQFRVQRELRRRLATALEEAGITAQIAASRLYANSVFTESIGSAGRRTASRAPGPVDSDRKTTEPPSDERR